MYPLFTRLMNMSLVAGIMVIVILVLRLFLRKAPRKFVCLLWALVALRLIFPLSISSSLSAFNLLEFDTNESGQVEYFQYNEKTEKPLLTFDHPGLVNDNMSPDSVTFGTKTTGVYIPTLTYVWIFGAGCMLAYAAFSYMQLRRGTGASIEVSNGIYVCDDIDSPFILGIVIPRIYLPSGMDEATKKSVIAHEKVHLQRHDHWWKPLGYLLLSVYWFNPLLWGAYVLLCRDIEAACDEKVIGAMDRESISAYSEALLSCAVKRRLITACPVAFGETDVRGRVKNVLNYRKPAFWIVCVAAILCIAAAVCLLTDPVDGESGFLHNPFKPNYGSQTRITIDNKVNDLAYGILIEYKLGGEVHSTYSVGGDGPLAADIYKIPVNKSDFPKNSTRDQAAFDVYVITSEGADILLASDLPLTFYEEMPFELISEDGAFTLVNSLSGEKLTPEPSAFSSSVMTAVITEIGNGSMTVMPVEGSPELASSDIFRVAIERLEPSPEPCAGDTVEISYDGSIMETYPAELGNVTGIRIIERAEDHRFVDYTQNPDGTYVTENGKLYKYLRTLIGRSPNAVCDSYYVVLTDSKDLDFETVNSILLSSSFNPAGAESFEIVSLGVVEAGGEQAAADTPWVWPCESRKISSGFGKRVEPITAGQSFHNEIDIAAEKGSAVVSAFSGTVISAEYEGGKGRFVEILHTSDACHEGEIITCYTHLDEICVGVGDSVQAGDKIGTVGSTGMSTGPHLGFGVLVDGEYVDPLEFYNGE